MRGAGASGSPHGRIFEPSQLKTLPPHHLSHFLTKDHGQTRNGVLAWDPTLKAFRPWLQTGSSCHKRSIKRGWILLSRGHNPRQYPSHYVARPTCHHTRRIGGDRKANSNRRLRSLRQGSQDCTRQRVSRRMNAGAWAEPQRQLPTHEESPLAHPLWPTFTATKNDGSPYLCAGHRRIDGGDHNHDSVRFQDDALRAYPARRGI